MRSVNARGAAVGIELAVAILGCMLAGNWADQRWDTGPWLTLGGVVLGSIVGIRVLVRATRESTRE